MFRERATAQWEILSIFGSLQNPDFYTFWAQKSGFFNFLASFFDNFQKICPIFLIFADKKAQKARLGSLGLDKKKLDSLGARLLKARLARSSNNARLAHH